MRDIALALIIFGTIPFILMRPYVGLLVWSWLGYMNPHRLTYGFAYSFPWVMLIAVVTLISLAVSKENKKIPVTTVTVLMLLFLAWTGLTTIFAFQQPSAWHTFEQFAKTLVMVFVTLMLVRDRERIDWLVWVIVASLGFYGVKGGAFTLVTGGGYHIFGPPASFIADNNDLAMAFCMVLPLMRYLQLQATKKSVKVALGASMALTGIAILGTYSRGGMIGLAIVTVALLVKGRRRVVLALALIAIGATAYTFMPAKWVARMDTLQHAREVGSAQTRIQSWEFAANVALHRPLIGGGFNLYRDPSLWATYAPEGAVERAVHSIYFRVLGEQGFPGLILFVGLLAASWRNCSRVRKRLRHSPEQRWAYDLASMLQVSLVAFGVAGAFLTSTYFDLSYQLMALTALLVTFALPQATEASAQSVHPGSASNMEVGPEALHTSRAGPRP
jgi:probable O-glycosylation ligase (exosortase A-associated)